MISIWTLLWPVAAIVGSVAGLFIVYWVIRLAVRHGIEDARRCGDRQPAADPGWDTARF